MKWVYSFGEGQADGRADIKNLLGGKGANLADEPTENLYSIHSDEVMKILAGLHEAGTTIVMVTHSPSYAELGTRCIHLLDGHVVAENMQDECHV
ncbi:MAG: hypothetical protein V3W14_03940 [Candidatus Neomarinimicrobiota bacterium]